MSEKKLRRTLIRLAHSKPELHPDLLPLLTKTGSYLSSVNAELARLVPYASAAIDALELVEIAEGILRSNRDQSTFLRAAQRLAKGFPGAGREEKAMGAAIYNGIQDAIGDVDEGDDLLTGILGDWKSRVEDHLRTLRDALESY